MDLQNHAPGEHARFEQIVTHFFLKSLHAILGSRVPSFHPHSFSREVKRSDKWFNLVLGDHSAPLDNLNFWRRNLKEPMIIDIILVQAMSKSSSKHDLVSASGLGMFAETIIERWVVQYEQPKAVNSNAHDTSYRKIYKKLIILMRSLYSMMRLLPAHKAFRKLSSSSQACEFDINYRVSSFSAPFSRAEEDPMKKYAFIPVEAQLGCLSVSVTYRESLSEFNLETCTSLPPEIIQDYVGSPATERTRAFPSSEDGLFATSFPSGSGMIQPPSVAPFQRPHTWTSGLHGGAHLAQKNPIACSPPSYHSPNMAYDYSSSPTDMFGLRFQNYRLSKATGSTDYQLSPPFSPSPSPSPSSPSHLSGGNLIRMETAPVSIPPSLMGRSSRNLSPNLSDPNRHLLPPMSPKSTKHDSSSQESPSGIRSFRKSDSLRSGDLNSGLINRAGHKVSRDSRDDSGRFSGLLSSSGSPRIGLSRSSSRLSFQDDLDECDFSYPFIVDDVDTSDFNSRLTHVKKSPEPSSQSESTTRRSQDAAVGALVHMLRTAPPLRQDSSCYSTHSFKTEVQGRFVSESDSEFLLHRKTSDALEELRGYKEMKELLLSKSRTGSNEA